MKLAIKTKRFGGYYKTCHPVSINRNDDPFIVILLKEGTIIVGDIVIIKTKYGFWETHSYLSPPYRGQGNGIKLYRAAIREARKRRLEIRSSVKPSDDAIRVWKSKHLRKTYKVRKYRNRFRVIS